MGFKELNCPHLTFTFNKKQLKEKWRGLLESMTKFSKHFDHTLFPSEEHNSKVHEMSGYDALEHALLHPYTDKLLTHVDSMNDKRDGYKWVAIYSKILENGWRLTMIAETRKSAGDFIDRLDKSQEQFLLIPNRVLSSLPCRTA